MGLVSPLGESVDQLTDGEQNNDACLVPVARGHA